MERVDLSLLFCLWIEVACLVCNVCLFACIGVLICLCIVKIRACLSLVGCMLLAIIIFSA